MWTVLSDREAGGELYLDLCARERAARLPGDKSRGGPGAQPLGSPDWYTLPQLQGQRASFNVISHLFLRTSGHRAPCAEHSPVGPGTGRRHGNLYSLLSHPLPLETSGMAMFTPAPAVGEGSLGYRICVLERRPRAFGK